MQRWHLAFIPARYTEFGTELPGGIPAAVASFFTYTLVHADLTHLLINAAWLLAFGSAVAMRIGGLRFMAFSAVCGACGALLFLLLEWGAVVPVVGASGAVSGLMAASFRFLFTVTDEHSAHALRVAPRSVPLMSVSAMLTNRRVLIVIAVWIVINFCHGRGRTCHHDDGRRHRLAGPSRRFCRRPVGLRFFRSSAARPPSKPLIDPSDLALTPAPG